MKIRILHCLETIGSGGVEQRRLSLGRYLDKEKYIQKLTCSKVIGAFDEKLHGYDVGVEQLGAMKHLFNLSYYYRLFGAIRKFKPHIIHGAVFEGVISAVIGGIFFRVPIIIIEETSEPTTRSWRGNALFRILSFFADAVVATSPAVHHYITKIAKVNNQKVHLIMNGVEPPIVIEQTQLDELSFSLGIKNSETIIGSVGRMFDHPKLFSVLIRAFKVVAQKKSDIKLLLVGDGPDKEMLQHLAEKLGVKDKVIFAGFQANVSAFYGLMNVFVLVSENEGFGMAAVEAMFFRLPLVATKVGGLKDVVSDGETGILVEVRNETQLCDALITLIDNPFLAKQMGEAGHDRAFLKFHAKRYVDEVQHLYMSLIKKEKQSKFNNLN